MTTRSTLTLVLFALPLLALGACSSDSTKADAAPKKDTAVSSEGGTTADGGADLGGGVDAQAPDSAVKLDASPGDAAKDSAPGDAPKDTAPADGPRDAAAPDVPRDMAPDITPDAAAPDAAATADGPGFEVKFSPDVGSDDIAVEAEDLESSPHDADLAINDDENASAGKLVFLNADTMGASIEFTLPGVPAGSYEIILEYKKDDNRGIATLSVDGTQVGGMVDQYKADEEFSQSTFGTVTFNSTGDHTLVLTATGKSMGATSFVLTADRFVLLKQ
jgi:hypothetical protein